MSNFLYAAKVDQLKRNLFCKWNGFYYFITYYSERIKIIEKYLIMAKGL